MSPHGLGSRFSSCCEGRDAEGACPGERDRIRKVPASSSTRPAHFDRSDKFDLANPRRHAPLSCSYRRRRRGFDSELLDAAGGNLRALIETPGCWQDHRGADVAGHLPRRRWSELLTHQHFYLFLFDIVMTNSLHLYTEEQLDTSVGVDFRNAIYKQSR